MIQKTLYKSLKLTIIVCFLVVCGCRNLHVPAWSIVLNPLFSDNMALQQKQKLPVWGTAQPGGEVTVTLNGQRETGIADEEGNWNVNLSPVAAGGPYESIISGKEVIGIKNVMVGEVWVCSGQSNMGMPFGGWGKVNNYQQEIGNAGYPDIRLVTVGKSISNMPRKKF